MKIALINQRFPPDIGGGETQAYLIALGLRRLGHKVEVFTGTKNALIPKGVKVTYLKEFKSYEAGIVNIKSFIPDLKNKILKTKFDIYYCLNFSSITAINFFRDLLPGKTVFTFHSVPEPYRNKLIGYFNDLPLELSYARNAIKNFHPDMVIATGKFMYKWSRILGVPKSRLRNIDNFVEVKKNLGASKSYKVKICKELKLPVDKFIYISTVRLLKKKGILDLIHALPYTDKNTFYVVCAGLKNGSVSVKREIDKYIKNHKLKNRVRFFFDEFNFLGINRLYKISDGFVLPSCAEGQPVSILEAFTTRLPVIAVKNEGSETLVKHNKNGWLVEAGNPKKLANTLNYVHGLSFQKRKTITSRAFRCIQSKYEIGNQVKKIEKILVNLLEHE